MGKENSKLLTQIYDEWLKEGGTAGDLQLKTAAIKDAECQQKINNKLLMLAVQLEDRGTWSKDGAVLTTYLINRELQALKQSDSV